MKSKKVPQVLKTLREWCVENNRMDIEELFDEELNCCTANDVGYQSNKQFYFKCKRGLHESELHYMTVVTNNAERKMTCRKCNSLAQVVIDKFGQEYLDMHWHPDNTVSPWEVFANSHTKVLVQCDKKDYHVYDQYANNFSKGIGCPFCINRKVHSYDSVGTLVPEIVDRWSKKNTKSPFEYSVHSKSRVWLICPEGKHEDYLQQLCNANIYEYRCPECSREANKTGPEDLSGQKFGLLTVVRLDTESKQCISNGYIQPRWWCRCECGNPHLVSVLAVHLKSGKIKSCGCLTKKFSLLERRVTEYIESQYGYKTLHEQYCTIVPVNPSTGRNMPYDNEIIFPNGKHLIVECHGEQHYKVTNFAKQTARRYGCSPEEAFEYQIAKDNFKKQYALSKDYDYLIIPYTAEKDDIYKSLIDEKFTSIYNNTKLLNP